MKNTAFVLGLVGSIIALLIGILGFLVGGAFGAGGYAALALLIPILGLIGASIVKTRAPQGGLLMAAAVVLSFVVFGIHYLSILPSVFLGIAAVMAFSAGSATGTSSATATHSDSAN